jgi:gas vesicle protein
MTDETPKTDQNTTNEVLDQLRELGKNLRDALQNAWDSEERKKLQNEIGQGLTEVSDGLSQAARDFKESPAGQTLRTEVEDFKERMRTGEVESKVRSEIAEALRVVNDELKKLSKKDE